MTATMSKKYRLYHLHLFVEVMTEEMGELMRFGVSPLGVGYVKPLEKDVQEKIRPLLMNIADRVKDAAVKMIEENVAAPDETLTSEEWIKIMLEELRTRLASIGGSYAQELNGVAGLLDQIEGTLAGEVGADEEK